MLTSIYAVFYGMLLLFVLGGASLISIFTRAQKGEYGLQISDYIMITLVALYIPIMIGVII